MNYDIFCTTIDRQSPFVAFYGDVLTLAGPIVFLHTPRPGGGGATPLAVWPLIELERRGTSERVGRYETQ